jgi:hypothetical protein
MTPCAAISRLTLGNGQTAAIGPEAIGFALRSHACARGEVSPRDDSSGAPCLEDSAILARGEFGLGLGVVLLRQFYQLL